MYNLREYLEFLTELADAPYHTQEVAKTKHKLTYSFDARSGMYEIRFIKKDDIWITAFHNISADNTIGVTNTGDAFRIFATVRQTLVQFMKTYQPETLMFWAEENNRIKLYDRMLGDIEGDFPDYRIYTRLPGRYIITKQKHNTKKMSKKKP